MKAVACFLIALAPAIAQNRKIDFIRDIRPVLSDRCFSCHGPDEGTRMANLRLDTADGAKKVLESGKLLTRISHEKKALRMPPPGTPELTPHQIELLQTWVQQGGEYHTHWAYEVPKRPEIPAVKNTAWPKNEIDRFILARLEKEDLKPSPAAGKATLLRRVTFDLTGLPPTTAELKAFLADSSPNAYEKVIDRLMASPQYGERMAMQWLDISRYADTHGFHIDSHREMWPWRDWVISAFNRNMPYDRFMVAQLAGDLTPKPSKEQLIATGFNRNHMINYEGGAIPEEYQTEYVVDRVEATSAAFLGLTMGCARCHDHKYDPIKQRDFYRFFAFFNTVSEKGLDGQKGNAQPFLMLPNAAQKTGLDRLNSRIAELEFWMDNALIPERRQGWEANAKLSAPPAEAASGPVASVRIKMSARLDTKPTTFLDAGGTKMWIDGGHAIGRNRRGSYLYLDRNGQVSRSNDYFVTGDWMHIVLNGNKVWLNQKPIEFSAATVEVPEKFERGTLEKPRFFAKELTAQEIRILGVEEPVRTALEVPAEKRNREQRFLILDYYLANAAPQSIRDTDRELEALYKEREDLQWETPSTMVMSEMAIPRETKILARGDYRNGTTPVTAGVPSFLPQLPKDAPQNRLGLAQWVVSPENPLTARVAVNRFWQMIFGYGIVKTAEDFGSQGEFPTHPQLLDWLATDFVASNWDVKALQKKILLSAAYRQVSKATPELIEKDPENRLLARGPRFRMPAEMIRDNALAVSGLLNGKIGGSSVYPYQPKGVWEDIAYGDTFSSQIYVQDHGDKLYRRSMYTFWKRTAPPPNLAAFDAPDREKCAARRLMTNTPLQALVLLNDPTFVEASRALAAKAIAAPDPLDYMFRTVLARPAEPREAKVLRAQLNEQLGVYKNYVEGAQKLLAVGESPAPAKADPAKLAAWTTVASVILNLDETVTKE